jgi:hypothetical protein
LAFAGLEEDGHEDLIAAWRVDGAVLAVASCAVAREAGEGAAAGRPSTTAAFAATGSSGRFRPSLAEQGSTRG